MNDNAPSKFDIKLGRRLRSARIMRGLGQQQVADALRVSYQQVQRYEKGLNRITAERLQAASKLLNAPISFFLGADDYEDERQRLVSAESLRLAARIDGLPDDIIRQSVVRLVASIHEAWNRHAR